MPPALSPTPKKRQKKKQKIANNKANFKYWTVELKKLRKLHKQEAEEWGLEDEEGSDIDSDSEDDDGDGMSDGENSRGSDEEHVDMGVEETKGEQRPEKELEREEKVRNFCRIL